MASDRLYELLAQAKARPSGAYRALESALGAVNDVGEGYMKGQEIQEAMRQKELAKRTLRDVLTPEALQRVGGYADIDIPTVDKLGGLTALAKITETKEPKVPAVPGSYDAVLSDLYNKGEISLDEFARRKRLASPGIIPKPPQGYEFVDGGMRPVRGGPAEQKVKTQEEKKRLSVINQKEKANLVIKKIDEALAGVGPGTVGMGALFRHIPGTPAKNLDATLNTIRANVGFDTLQEIRLNSPTGGALGQISDKENKLMQDVRSSMDQEQSSPQIIANLKELKTHYNNVMLINEFQTGIPEADDAIAQVIASGASDAEKRARVQGIHAEALGQ